MPPSSTIGASPCQRMPSDWKLGLTLTVIVVASLIPPEHWPALGLLLVVVLVGLTFADATVVYLIRRLAIFLPVLFLFGLSVPMTQVDKSAAWTWTIALSMRCTVSFLAGETSKGYLAIYGLPEYDRLVQQLLFNGAGGTPQRAFPTESGEHEILASGRAATVQSPGGTGALRVAADLLQKKFPVARVWFSKPTWANHQSIFSAAGLRIDTYPYIDAAGQGLDFAALLAALKEIPAGDVVVLHACCHNPTGIDPTPDQWKQIADLVDERKLLPLVDFAYQGFGDGLQEDAAGLRELCRPGRELLVCSSFSKNPINKEQCCRASRIR